VADKISPKDVHLPEVLLEMVRVGKSLRVTAIDPITGTEVILIAAANATRNHVKRIAARKLAYVIAKKQEAGKL
jgi:hypothetical protein